MYRLVLISWLASWWCSVRTLTQNFSIWDLTGALKSAGESFFKGSKVIHQSQLSIKISLKELKTIFKWETQAEFKRKRQIKQSLCKRRVLISPGAPQSRQSVPLFRGLGEGQKGQRSTLSVASGLVLVVHVQRHLNVRQLHLTHHATWRAWAPAEKVSTCKQ